MGKTLVKIGPADHGRKMSLEEFEHAEVQEGYLYELSRGIITVSDVPHRRHMLLVAATRDQLQDYKSLNRGRIHIIASGSECKLLIPTFDSERHPDLAVYLTEPPPIEDASLWQHWFPEIVIEVVSPSSRKRDYEEKPDEYLRRGAREYWVIDPRKRALVVMRRTRNRWTESLVRPPAIPRTRLLPGLEFSCGAVFEAAGLS
ncbi:MAG TPA: Uma2 family endonuclease [Isosphaeraceae bacterium]|nr:Uma2 family endonuclease [Isosphaeraceae bacterium]